MAARLQRLRRGVLTETFPFAGPAFRRAAPWLLAGVAFLGLLARLHPAFRYAVWGSDSGEYVFLTQQLVDTGRVLFEYDGWGIAYPYFPGMFVVSGAVHAVIGVDVFHATLWTTPILAALLGVLVGLLGYRITSDPRTAVVAGVFVAVSATVVTTTSHAMPGTLGQVLLFGLFALLPDAHRDTRHYALFAVLGLALVWTHHLTTYFAVGILAFVPFYREMMQRSTDMPRVKMEAGTALYLLVLAAFWWLVVADPFRDEIVGDALPLPAWLTTILFLAALGTLPLLVRLKRRRTDWHQIPRYPSFPAQRIRIAVTALGIWLVVLFAATVHVPGSGISVGRIALLYVVPVLAFVAFLPIGMPAVRFHKHGVVLIGMLYAILASLAFAIATNSHVLFPFRHVDYMAMAMAPLAAVGMLVVYDQALASKIPAERPRIRGMMLSGLAVAIALSLVLSLPPRSALGGFEEGITSEELDAVRWLATHRDIVPENSTLAADHRISSLAWGLAGLHATWDYTPRTYHAENASEALAELNATLVPPRHGLARVDYVFLSPPIEEGVTLLQWETSRPMSEAAIAKFEDPRWFEKVYDERGVRVYRVQWANATAS